jgi:RNA polymerase sigma factor (TIGR02999 family)
MSHLQLNPASPSPAPPTTHDGLHDGLQDSVRDGLSRLFEQNAGEGVEVSALWAAAYSELKQLARARLRASGPLTLLDTTGLVNDAYARLAAGRHRVGSREHFMAYSSRVMRSVIIDLIRERQAQRRGGDQLKVTLNTAIGDVMPAGGEEEPLRVDEALQELAALEPRLAQVVEMRYFGGYTENEIADTLGVGVRTVQRDWRKARALLQSMLSRPV